MVIGSFYREIRLKKSNKVCVKRLEKYHTASATNKSQQRNLLYNKILCWLWFILYMYKVSIFVPLGVDNVIQDTFAWKSYFLKF